MPKAKIILTKSQSILEYLIVLTAIMVGIIASTVGFHRGLQNSLDEKQMAIEANIKGNETPQEVKNEAYYAAAHNRTDSAWSANIDQKNISATFKPEQYYFHEGNSDMSGYDTTNGTVPSAGTGGI
jgi:hypothetical protein